MRICSECKEKERSWNFQESICHCSYEWCENYKEEIYAPKKKKYSNALDIRNFFEVQTIIKRQRV